MKSKEHPSRDQLLTQATRRAAQHLGLKQQELKEILHTSASTTSRIFNDEARLSVDSAEGQLALLFLRVFRSLDTLVGGQPEKAQRWFKSENLHLGGEPLRLARTPQGLAHVADYLDAMRGKL